MEEIRSYYSEKARSYDDVFEMFVFRVLDAITWKYLEPYLPEDPEALVLDAGGGTGRWAIRMAEKGCKVVLLDASEEMLKAATRNVKRAGFESRITVKKGDLISTGYADETFEMAFCEQTLFLFKKPDTLLGEIHRVLKKRARLIISAQNLYAQCLASISENPNPDNVDNALRTLSRKRYNTMANDGKVKIYTWTPNEFRVMLERNGFDVEKIVGKGITMPLRISKDLFMKKEYPEDLYKKVLEFEFALCEKPDALALAGHLQAIAHRKN
jgi:ubiquinone/menaquinone biosynthesis C-methylase UbiE